jgi:hypothetical protein
MSRLFRRTDAGGEEPSSARGHLPSLFELGSQVDDAASRAAAVPLDQFAAQLMTRFFTSEHLVASKITGLAGVDPITWSLLPDNDGEKAGEPIPDAFFGLQDLVSEAVQLLKNAGLVMERSYKVGQGSYSQWLTGLVTTRRGRAALDNGTVGQIVGAIYPGVA